MSDPEEDPSLFLAGDAVSEALSAGLVEDGDHAYVLLVRAVFTGGKTLPPDPEEQETDREAMRAAYAELRDHARRLGAGHVDHTVRDLYVRSAMGSGEVAERILEDVMGFAKRMGLPPELADEAVEYAKSRLG